MGYVAYLSSRRCVGVESGHRGVTCCPMSESQEVQYAGCSRSSASDRVGCEQSHQRQRQRSFLRAHGDMREAEKMSRQV